MRLYTIDEVSKLLCVHQRTVRRYIERGTLRAERVGGSWRITEDALKDVFQSEEVRESIAHRSEDMISLYLQGRHRLQEHECPVMTTLVYDPQKEPWVTVCSAEWLTALNAQSDDEHYDFTMTGNEHSSRWILIASPEVTHNMMGELESLQKKYAKHNKEDFL